MASSSVGRWWLDVPYSEKDLAKAAGARWDARARRWYAPRPDIPALGRWAARPDLPVLLPGEDRSFGGGLFVDLVPSSCWFTNARSCVTGADWERLRRVVLSRADQRCEACGRGPDRDAERWLEVHERWDYDEHAHVQRLRRLVCLCTDCHTATHFGLASVRGRDGAVLTHLCQVTGLTEAQAREHVDAAFELWSQRSTTTWVLDLSILINAGIVVTPPPPASDR